MILSEDTAVKVEIEGRLIGNNSKSLYHVKEHVVIGVSPFNSFFSEERLVHLFRWAMANFKEWVVFSPTGLSYYTLCAIGYSEQKARQKTKRQDNYLKNKLFRVLNFLGFSKMEAASKLLDMNKLILNPKYQELFEACVEKFEIDHAFMEGCLSASRWVLSKNESAGLVDSTALKIASQYFLAELPLFLDTPFLLDVKSSIFAYPSMPDYLKYLYIEGEIISPNQGFFTDFKIA